MPSVLLRWVWARDRPTQLPDLAGRDRLPAVAIAHPPAAPASPRLWASIRRVHPASRVVPAARVDLDRVDLDLADLRPVGLVAQAVRANIPAARVARVARVDLANTPAVPVDPADLRPVGLVAQADLATQVDRVVRAARADLAITPVDLAVPAGLAAPVDPVVPGTETVSVATSTARRGATDLALGDRASHRDPIGEAGRSRRRAARGTMARSTTSATRKPRSGTPVSTRGASGSSECGSRCKEQLSTTPASPLGEAGVVFSTGLDVEGGARFPRAPPSTTSSSWYQP